MARFLLSRLLQIPLILVIIYLITFLLAWVAPGSPFQRSDRNVSPEVLEAMQRQYHADSPWTFLATYPLRMLQLDFGPSFSFPSHTVGQILAATLPISLMLGAIAILLATAFGVTIGTLAAVRRGGPIDWLGTGVALLGVSVPSFVAAVGLSSIFSYWLNWTPLGWDETRWTSVILPSIALALLPMAYITRLTRVSMIDTLSSDYVRTARAKGVSRTKVVFKHALRNALIPVLSFIGPATAATLVGSFVVEKAFNIPGLGNYFIRSVSSRDQTLILACVMVYSVLLLTLNLLVDVAYTLIDPRIELES